MNVDVAVTTMFPVRERAIVATTGPVTPLLLYALLKAFRIRIRLKSEFSLFTERGVAYTRITLRSVGFAFASFGGFIVVLGPRACPVVL